MEDHAMGVEIEVCSHAGYPSHCHPGSNLQVLRSMGSDYEVNFINRAGNSLSKQ
jgi:hypothetical protein